MGDESKMYRLLPLCHKVMKPRTICCVSAVIRHLTWRKVAPLTCFELIFFIMFLNVERKAAGMSVVQK